MHLNIARERIMVFVRLWVLASHFCLIVGSHLLLDDIVAMDYAVYLYN